MEAARLSWPARFGLIMLAALALPSCVSKKSPAGMFDIGRLSAAGEMIDGLVESGQIPGGAVRISQHGELLFEHYAGKADIACGKNIAPDTIYRAYSMTKPVTAERLLLAVDEVWSASRSRDADDRATQAS